MVEQVVEQVGPRQDVPCFSAMAGLSTQVDIESIGLQIQIPALQLAL